MNGAAYGFWYFSFFASILILIVLLIASIFDRLLRVMLLVCVTLSILLVCLDVYNNPISWNLAIITTGPFIFFFEILSLITYGIIKFVRWWKNRGAASEEAENLG